MFALWRPKIPSVRLLAPIHSASAVRFCATAAVVPPIQQQSLKGKKALITGSSSGIGKGIALKFAAAGADIVINCPSGDPVQIANCKAIASAVHGSGQVCVIACGDVSKEADVAKIVDTAVAELGSIDILVNNAGIATGGGPVTDIKVDDFDQLMAVNVRGTFLCTRAVLPIMYKQKSGKIINTASQLAYKGAPGFSHYCASKGAILSFTRSVALEVSKSNINVNAVAPGATMTPILEGLDKDMLDAIVAGIPRGQMANVDDITPSYVFLASDASSHFVGQCISPNGGDHFL